MYKIVQGLVAVPTSYVVTYLTPAASRTRAIHIYKFRNISASSAAYKKIFFPAQPLNRTASTKTSSSLVTLLHPQAQSSLKITNRSFRYAAPHLWNKLPPSLRVPCQSATSECSPPLPGSESAPKSVVGVSHGVFHSRLKTHLFSRSFPP